MPFTACATKAAPNNRRAITMNTVARGLPVAALAILLSACAQSPENIKPFAISSGPYAYLSCPQLAQYKATLTAAYNTAADSENTARMEDAVTLLLPIPVGSATHESVPWQIADLKGRIDAVQELQVKDSCDRQQAAAK
jgi:hypothetical protein